MESKDLTSLGHRPEGPTPSRYRWSWNGVNFDFYRLCEILGIKSHPQAHALKKVIRAGQSIKPIEQEIDEAVDSLLRWKEMVIEDKKRALPSFDLGFGHPGETAISSPIASM